ncbi:MAG: elongation factor Ts [Ruminococcaceae bacterium]|jgi:elongation factor Ts|nr:elongation factor Ts [Oscillospiraceae bacterium]
MANISAKDVKELREKTGVGMMECKKALVEADGDMEKAIDFLRERGLAAAQKKASRIAAEGVVLPYYDKAAKKGVVVEVNSETDFVAKNEKFMNFVEGVAKTVLATDPADVEALKEAKYDGTDRTVTETLNDLVLAIGENMKIRRFERMDGVVSTYIHAGGSVGVMVGFDVADESKADTAEFEAMGKNVAMQIAAMNPEYLGKANISDAELDKMHSITVDSALNKPDSLPMPILTSLVTEAIDGKKWSDDDINIYQGLDNKQRKNFKNFISTEAFETLAGIAVSHKADIVDNKIFTGLVQGRLSKQIKEICLLEQEFVRSDIFQGSVQGYVDSVAKELGTEIKVNNFIRMMKGDGLEKREENFAEEIAKQING